MFDVDTHRRYAFGKMLAAAAAGYESIADTWDGIRRGDPGTPIPTTFPARTVLLAAGYLVLEEVQGADETELTKAGLTPAQAAAVIAAAE